MRRYANIDVFIVLLVNVNIKDYRSKVYLFLSEIVRADIPGYGAEQYIIVV